MVGGPSSSTSTALSSASASASTLSQQQEQSRCCANNNTMIRSSSHGPRSSSSSFSCCSSPTWCRWMTIVLAVSTLCQGVDSYSCGMMQMMTYKPPVKSSVSKLGNSRSPPSSSSSSSTSRHGPGGDPSKSSSSSPPSRSRTSKNAAAASVLHPELQSSSSSSPSSPSTKSFEDRMRNLVMGQRTTVKRNSEPLLIPRSTSRTPSSTTTATTTTTTRQNPHLPPNVITVESLAHYKTVVGDERERVVAVRFYAPWCRACRAVAPLYYKMAQSYPNVVFVDVPVTQENAKLHQGLGVPSLPYGHIYHPQGGLVEEVRISRKQIVEFHHKLQSYIVGQCDLKDNDDDDEYSGYSSPYATTVLTGHHDEEDDEEEDLQ